MVGFLEERRWGIFNGTINGDEEREFTFTGGRGNSVIDYIMRDKEVRERVVKMRVRERVESDHQPFEVWLRGERREKGRGKIRRGR